MLYATNDVIYRAKLSKVGNCTKGGGTIMQFYHVLRVFLFDRQFIKCIAMFNVSATNNCNIVCQITFTQTYIFIYTVRTRICDSMNCSYTSTSFNDLFESVFVNP